MRIGYGYDVHRLVKNRKLILGGVSIPHDLGLLGHSDADVLLHAIIDALLGAMALGDIGCWFPDNAPQYKNIDSRLLLRKVYDFYDKENIKIGNIDATICAQKPKLRPFIDEMRKNIATDLHIDLNQVSVKATTEESLGITGDEQGMSATAVVLVNPK